MDNGVEDGGAAWRGAGSSSSRPSQSWVAGGGGLLLAALSWTLGRQLVSSPLEAASKTESVCNTCKTQNSRSQDTQCRPGRRLCPIRRTHGMRVIATKHKRCLRASDCICQGCSITISTNRSGRCTRQLTWFNCHATLVPHFRDGEDMENMGFKPKTETETEVEVVEGVQLNKEEKDMWTISAQGQDPEATAKCI